MVKFSVEMKKRDLVWVGLFVVLIGVGVVVAYNANGTGGTPSVMGHSADEIAWESYYIYRSNADNNEAYGLELPNGDVKSVDGNALIDGAWVCDADKWICVKKDSAGSLGIVEYHLVDGPTVGCFLLHYDDDAVKEWAYGADVGNSCQNFPCFKVANPGRSEPLAVSMDQLGFICI